MSNSRKKIARRIAVSSGAAVAALALGAGTAFAAPPSDVDVGGHTTPQQYEGTDADGITFVADGQTMTCATSVVSGEVTPGSTSWLPATFATVTGSTWTNCVGPAGIPLEVTHNGTWNLGINGDTVGGVTPGEVVDIQAHVENPAGLCSFDVSGSVAVEFHESDQTLYTDPNDAGLTVTNVNGCLGLIDENSSATFDGEYHITDTAGVEFPITITSS